MYGNTTTPLHNTKPLPINKFDCSPVAHEALLHISDRANKAAPAPVDADSSEQELPLAFAQRGMWIGEKIGPADAIYNLAEYTEILGRVDPGWFIAALQQVADEAEACRVQIVESDAGPRQVITSMYQGEIPFIDLSAEADPRAVAERWMMDELARPLDISRDPLWFCALFKAEDSRYFWYQRCHHVTLDGFGAGLISRRVAEIYSAFVEGREPTPTPFQPLSVQIEHERKYRSSPRFSRDQQYWSEQLAGLPEPISLARQAATRGGGLRRSTARLSVTAGRRLRRIGQEAEGSLPQVLISLLGAYIYRMTGAEDLVFGMPVTARANKTVRSIPGMMANAVAIRLAMSPELTLAELIGQTATTVRNSLRHQQYRYEELRRDLGLLGNGQQISWVGVNIEPFDYDLSFGGHRALTHNLSNGTIEDLTVFVYDRGNDQGLRFDLDANPSLYSQAELDEHRDRLVRMIETLMAEPALPIGQIDLLSSCERQQLLQDWNATERDLPNALWPSLFEQQVARSPQAPAVQAGDGGLSYADLNAQANRLCHALLAQRLQPGDVVAVALPRDASMPTALLAALKSGATYLPLDPSVPAERLRLILEEARPSLMITTAAIRAKLPSLEAPCLCLDQLSLDAYPTHNPTDADRHGKLSADTPAYVIYTSGSTGRPKGVVIGHGSLVNFLMALQDELAIDSDDRLLALTTIAFDIAALELYLPLMVGAQVVVASRDVARDPAALAALIKGSGVTVMQATPSHWQALLADHAEELHGLRPLVGGEALPGQLAHKLRELGHPVTNLYGPTETTIWSTMIALDGDDLSAPPVGRPIWNTQVYVLDQSMQPVPVGVVGELYIGGAGVAQGYLHRPELTAERFLPNPFGEGRLYKTGDQARWRADGVLEFLGRNDFQIKIRGFRIEAEEVEANMERCATVKQAVVVLRDDPAGDKRLVGYVLPEQANAELNSAALRAELEQRLPDYMIPALFVAVDTLPLNVNGKLDRKALPEPQWQGGREYVPPRTPLEQKLAAMWCEIFGLEQIGVHDSFFDLGGDSLTAARMIARLRELTEREISLAAIFEATTIAELAQQLENHQALDPLSSLLPLNSTGLNSTGEEAPLFCMHPVVGLSWGYAGLVRHLGSERPLYGLQARGLQDGAELPGSIEEMAEGYLQDIRQVQPQGPYHLLGWSLGGVVAHEVARRLQAEGEEVAFLAILDAYPFVQSAARQRDEALLVQSALDFLGFERGAMGEAGDLNSLTDFLCREYDVFNLPVVQELQLQQAGDGTAIIDRVRRVIENNLELLQHFVPGRVDGDVLFVQATETAQSELLHHSPAAWNKYVGGKLQLHKVGCHHQQMLDADALEAIGPVLASALAERSTQALPAAKLAEQ